MIQYILLMLLRKQGAQALPELTVRLSASKYLVPDVCMAGDFSGPYPTEPVLLCCEILSPEDSLGATLAKCEEYHGWGVPFCWVIDPVKRTAWEYHAAGEPVRAIAALRAGELSVALDELFAALDSTPNGDKPRRYHGRMSVGTLLSVDEYLRTSFDPDCDFIEGEVLERNVGKRKHSYAQGEIGAWFRERKAQLRLQPFPEIRLRVAPGRVRIPEVALCEFPLPDEEVFTTPPYLCVEVMSPDDTIAGMQDRLDDYLQFGVPNIWVVDPWKHRGWRITSDGWAVALNGIMRTADGNVAMSLADVLLP